MTNLKENWEEVLSVLSVNLNSTAFKTWFSNLKIKSLDKENKILYVITHKELSVTLLNSRYRSVFESAIQSVFGENYTFSLEYKKDEPLTINNVSDKEPEFKDEYYLNPRYSFENFVTGSNNELAYAVSFAVAENPSGAYNPLFLYGGSGLGKTHLMHAIGHHILKTKDNLKVLYVSSEMFVNEMISALRKNELRNENKMGEFRKKYREIDVLLIDDIQFLENKEAVQEEFFNTFNSLLIYEKQIIISSDKHPSNLKTMDERLKSRLVWNMVADISPPNYETRVAILKNMADNENLTIDDDLIEVINLIAENMKENVRELEGAFTRIHSFSKIMNQKIDLSFSKKVLKEIFISQNNEITPEKIKKYVCNYFNIRESDIISSKRTKDIAFARQIAMYLLREMTDLSLPKIGEYFGGRDHSTVLHACDKIKKEVDIKSNVKSILDELQKQLKEN